MRIEPQDGPYRGSPSYDEATLLEVEVTEPSYQAALDWMQAIDGPHASYDFWQRGNYTRRLIHQRSQGITPLYVRVSYVDEMRWAYRRLALLGLPIDFVYCGGGCTKGRGLHLCPAYSGFYYDAGWGYIVALGGPAKIRGRNWGMCLGEAYLLPEAALDWMIEEAGDAFLQGRLSIAPAELIGVDPDGPEPSLGPLPELTGGMSLAPEMRAARALMDLEIPFLDRMPASSFSAFLEEHASDLEPFQRAFQKLVAAESSSESEILDHVEEIKHAVNELVRAQRSSRLQKTATLLQGAIATASASVGAAHDPSNPVNWIPMSGAAGVTLLELWKQARQEKVVKPFSLLWDLGMTSAEKVKATRRSDYTPMPTLPLDRFEQHGGHHWLCPPTPGVGFLALDQVREG